MGSSSDFFNLTWNEFQTTVATSFHDLRSNEEFLDVTLAIDQDHQCQAHKVILSASSPYFRSVLRRNQTAPNPVLIMPANVRYNDLRALLDFVYQGEVKIPTNELEEFLALAKLLKIKGLTEKTEKVVEEEKGEDNINHLVQMENLRTNPMLVISVTNHSRPNNMSKIILKEYINLIWMKKWLPKKIILKVCSWMILE